MSLELDTPIQFVKGVGKHRSEQLEKVGIKIARDLLRYKPFRYEDRTSFCSIRDVKTGISTLLRGRILAAASRTTHRKRMRILELVITDGSGSLAVKFFNQPYLAEVLKADQEVVFYGIPRTDSYSSGISLANPEFEILKSELSDSLHNGRIVPVYRRVGTLTSRSLRVIMAHLLDGLEGRITERLPGWILDRYGFPVREDAIRRLHFPVVPDGSQRDSFLLDLGNSCTPMQQRLVFEEFFDFQCGLQVVRSQRKSLPKERIIRITSEIREIVKSVLSFHPTSAQKRVVKEIANDLCSGNIMNRLLQGDVGSGKTIVAVQAMVIVVENGYQCALMVPTEILAEQHFETLRRDLNKADYKIALLKGRLPSGIRREILSKVADGTIQIVVGTHAVFQKSVKFQSLGLVVIDEQHRFGVIQRMDLQQKGERPDTLVMTATPIPRSLALTLYGDLDLSVIDQLPPGRKPVLTRTRTEAERPKVYQEVVSRLRKGQQCYIVYPLVEESEKVEARAAKEMSGILQETVFCDFKVGLLHGRLDSKAKDNVMQQFRRHDLDVLVTTTVIEVGVDVPNATLMVIEHANRFGLSQLHQLRGRVGRGSDQSICFLMSSEGSSFEARQRLDIMQQTNDGFQISEKDLEIRGPGDFVGTKQSGLPQFHFANLVRDRVWLRRAYGDAEQWFKEEMEGEFQPTHLKKMVLDWERRFGLFHVG
jgi:ATP-dependent DNA helicase RecG